MTDIRLDAEFLQNPKTRKLKKRLGLEGLFSLIALWLWAAKNKPDGNLSDLDEEDVALVADWDDEPQKFVSALVELHWLDETDTGYALHNWSERNPWAADAESRKDKARLSRLAGVNPEEYARYRAEGRDGISAQEFRAAKTRPHQRRVSNTSTIEQQLVNEPLTTTQQLVNEPLTPAPALDPAHMEISDVREISDPMDEIPPHTPPVTGGGGECVAEPSERRGRRRKQASEPQEFADFYAAYPRKVARSVALKAWLRIRPDPCDVMAGLKRWNCLWESKGEEGRQYIPYPATFLNREQWKEDDGNGWSSRRITEHWSTEGAGEREQGSIPPPNYLPGDKPSISDEEADRQLEALLG